jgi:hypothetical protein
MRIVSCLLVGGRKANEAFALLFPTHTPLCTVHVPTESNSIHVKPYVNGFLASIQMRYVGAGERVLQLKGENFT